jgi:hypothetical protein
MTTDTEKEWGLDHTSYIRQREIQYVIYKSIRKELKNLFATNS